MNDQNPKQNIEMLVDEVSAERAAGKHRKKKSSRTKVILISVGALLLALLIGGLYFVYGYNRVYPGVKVCGEDISNLTYSKARDALEEKFTQLNENCTLVVTIDKDYTVGPEDSGINYNLRRTVSQAMDYGRKGSVFSRIGSIFRALRRGAEIDPVMTMDKQKLSVHVQKIAQEVASSVIQPSWSCKDGVLTVDKGQDGYAVDAEQLLGFVKARLTKGDFSKAEFSPDIQNPKPLEAAEIIKNVQREVALPTLDLKADPSGRKIKPGQPGLEVDSEKLNALLQGTDRIGTMKVKIILPKYSDEEFKTMLFRDVLSKASTSFNASNVGRTTNVVLATEACNNVILLPGDVFSYNRTVGPRTYERGFKDAIVYVGTTAEAGVGGGICQVSSSIYYAVLRSDLEIVERYAHSRVVSYVPLGEDATVAWGSKDFKFKNNTDFPIKVVTSHTDSSLTIKIYGTQTVQGKKVEMDTKVISHTPFTVVHETDSSLPAGSTKVKSNGYDGYVSETYRVVYVNGKEVSRSLENKSRYTKYDKVILENPTPAVNPQPVPDPVPTPSPAPSPDPAPTDPAASDTPVNP